MQKIDPSDVRIGAVVVHHRYGPVTVTGIEAVKDGELELSGTANGGRPVWLYASETIRALVPALEAKEALQSLRLALAPSAPLEEILVDVLLAENGGDLRTRARWLGVLYQLREQHRHSDTRDLRLAHYRMRLSDQVLSEIAMSIAWGQPSLRL